MQAFVVAALMMSLGSVSIAAKSGKYPVRKPSQESLDACPDASKAMTDKLNSDTSFRALVASRAKSAIGSKGTMEVMDAKVDCSSMSQLSINGESSYNSNRTEYLVAYDAVYSPKDAKLVVGSASVMALFEQTCANGGPDGDKPTGCMAPIFKKFVSNP